MESLCAITLNGVKILSRDLFLRYYSFDEIYRIIEDDPQVFYYFLDGLYPRWKNEFFGTSGRPADNKTVIGILKHPEKCSEWKEDYFEPAGQRRVRIRTEKLQKKIAEQYESIWKDMRTASFMPGFSSTSEYTKNVEKFLSDITENGEKCLDCKCAAVIYLYLCLNAMAASSPCGTKLRQELNAILAELGGEDPAAAMRLSVGKGCTELALTGVYRKTEGENENIDIVKIENNGTETAAVYIPDTVLRRRLQPGETLYALRRAGRYISFLPRAAIYESTLFCKENGKLCMSTGGTTSYIRTSAGSPSCWAHCNSRGTLIACDNGKIDSVFFQGTVPSQPVVSVAAMSDCCILTADGTALNSAARPLGSGRMIGVYAGVGRMGAINENRTPVIFGDHAAKKIDFADAADMSIYDVHYICLSTDGRICTDSGLVSDGTVYAAAVYKEGYLIAKEETVEHYGFDNSLTETFHVRADEIVVSNVNAMYYDAQSGKFRDI